MPQKEIIQLRHTLHRRPELSCRETETQALLIRFLREHTDLEIVPQDGWFYALYRSSAPRKRPPIAFRADFDALPMEEGISLPYGSERSGVSHKCGHDGHAAALAGFGTRLDRLGPDRDVYLIFQHGEEIGAGGEMCSALLREKGISEVYACHNWSGFPLGQVLVREGTAQCASQGLTVRFAGTPAHASQPENGVNPCAALAELALQIQTAAGYGRQADRGPLVFATIVGLCAGGRNFGMSASSGELSVTLRAERQADMEALREAILAKAEALARRDGLSLSFEEADRFPDTVCSRESVEKVLRCADALSLSARRLEQPFRASEDFGYYLRECPGAIFYVGNGTDHPEIHTSRYDFPDKNLDIIMDMFAALCME